MLGVTDQPLSGRIDNEYAAQAPSAETIVAPSGVWGVHCVPNAGHSCGFFIPFRTSPLRHTDDSSVSIHRRCDCKLF